MIDKAIEIIKAELEEYLKQFSPDGFANPVVKPLDLNGTIPTDTSIGMTLVSIEEERVNKAQNPYHTTADGVTVKMNPELHLNLFIMFSAFGGTGTPTGHYEESLKRLSRVISFFQGKKVFTHENTPAMDSSLDRLYLDIHNLNSEQQNDLWGKFNANYYPSICYRIRLITVQNYNASAESPVITAPDVDLHKSN